MSYRDPYIFRYDIGGQSPDLGHYFLALERGLKDSFPINKVPEFMLNALNTTRDELKIAEIMLRECMDLFVLPEGVAQLEEKQLARYRKLREMYHNKWTERTPERTPSVHPEEGVR